MNESGTVSTPRPGRSAFVRVLPVALGIIGLVAVSVGLALMINGQTQSTFGWFAYAPLSDKSFSPAATFLSARGQTGLTIAVIGAIVFAFCSGWMLASRRRA
jgi:heme/copper-type cytochrome/quinol oxidase subunit 1